MANDWLTWFSLESDVVNEFLNAFDERIIWITNSIVLNMGFLVGFLLFSSVKLVVKCIDQA